MKHTVQSLAAGWILIVVAMAPAGAEPWPYTPFDETHGVGNHYGEFQNYGGSDSYYHDGIDLVTPGGPTRCYSVSDGTLTHYTYYDPLYSGMMIGQPFDGGLGWVYWHITSTTFQFDIGDQVHVNDYIGTTANWPVSLFHHTHFNRVRGTGGYPWAWYESIENPLSLMVPNMDPVPPEFENTYQAQRFAFRPQGSGTILNPTALSGDVDIVSRIRDIVGMPQWGLNPFRIDYWIDGGASEIPLTNAVTFSGHIPPDNTIGVLYSSVSPLITRGNYDARVFYFIVTNTDGDGFVESSDANGCWHTAATGAGDYWVYVRAADVGGNVVTDSMLCTVSGSVNCEILLPETSHDFGWVQPEQSETWPMVVRNVGTDWLSLRNLVSTDPAFTVNPAHAFIAPGDSLAVIVTFAPASPAIFTGSVLVSTNDADEPEVEIDLRGMSIDPAALPEQAAAAVFGVRGARSLGSQGIAIHFVLEKTGSAALEVFDAAGRGVSGVEWTALSAGAHAWTWDGRDKDGHKAPSGVYFTRLRSSGRESGGSAVLLR